MISHEESNYCVLQRPVKRGDVYYADFGSVKNAVGFEFAKRRPVLIIQNDIGNMKSGTTIALCLSSKCKSGLPFRILYDDLSVIKKPSDICAEQIKTIDKSRLEDYLGNVGTTVMKEVDRVVAFSLGICEEDISEIGYAEQNSYESEDTESIIRMQLSFWQNMKFRMAILETEKMKLDEEIESVLYYIEGSLYNAAQGYKVYKVLRKLRDERKNIMKELTYLQVLSNKMDPDKIINIFNEAIGTSNNEINNKEKFRFIEELMESVI